MFVLMEDSTTEATRASIGRKFDSFAKGELDHAIEMLSTLWGIANGNREIKVPLNTSPPVGPGLAFPSIARECSLHTVRLRKP